MLTSQLKTSLNVSMDSSSNHSPSFEPSGEPEVKVKSIYITPLDENSCITHDGYIQIGIFSHSMERHIELNPTINWMEAYWYPDIFKDRYKRVTFQRTEKCNEGSPKTDNDGGIELQERPRDFPGVSAGVTIQEETRLERTV